jgi:heme/copper-type cytochrome/quinol oxidase subunit 2
METEKGTGNPLGAMYLLAAVLMFVATLVIVVMMFVPAGGRNRIDPDEAYVPGSLPGFQPLNRAGEIVAAAPGTREIAPGRYLVTMSAYNWEFHPREIRVPVGSEVTFRATSMEDYHGIAIIGTDVILSLTQQEPAEATYTFTERGEYLFVCSEYCGAGHAAMQGYVIVE